MLNAIDAGTMCIETNVASPDAITSLMPSASDCIDAWEQQELFETARRVICRVVADAIKACIPELPNGVVVELKRAGKTFRIAQSAPRTRILAQPVKPSLGDSPSDQFDAADEPPIINTNQ